MGYSNLDSRDIVADFYPRFEQAVSGSWAPLIGMPIESDTKIEHYEWLGQASSLRKWVGQRQEQGLNKFSYQLANDKYESTLPIPLDDLRRDKTSQLRIRIGDMALKAGTHWEKLASTVLDANSVGYDGVGLFSNAHPESGTNQTNDLTATEAPALNVTDPTNPTPDEMAKILVQVIGRYYMLTDDKGDPTNGQDKTFLAIAPNALYWAAIQAAISLENLSQGASNQMAELKRQGLSISTTLEPRLTTTSAANQFILASTSSITKGLVLQEEMPLETQLLGAGSDYEFDHDAHKFGIKANRNVGPGFWAKILRGTLN